MTELVFRGDVFPVILLICFVLTITLSIFFRIRQKDNKKAKMVLTVGSLIGLLFCAAAILYLAIHECSTGLCDCFGTFLFVIPGCIVNIFTLVFAIFIKT
jgi:hypothetical protein